MEMDMTPAVRRPREGKSNQRGIALVIVIFALLVLTTLAAAIIFTTQTEVQTTGNYKSITQARYAAEAGAQRAINWFTYSYTLPSTLSSFDMTKYPVQYSNQPVVLSAMDGVNGNYPTS